MDPLHLPFCVFVLVLFFKALILGGYTISSAFSRCKIELRVASFLQTQLGHMPLAFLFAVMCLGFLLSMMISNHTAPILCSAIILPIIRDLPNDSRFFPLFMKCCLPMQAYIYVYIVIADKV